MRFIDRETELAYLKEAIGLSKKKLFTISIYGLRRVGKTRLILETLTKDSIYFFVNKNKGSRSLLDEYEHLLKERAILTGLESLKTWDEFFDVLFKRFKGIVAFDEFQNFAIVDSSVFGILQKQIDLNENKSGIMLIFSGSTIGLIKKLFSDSKEPLYGRLKRKMPLQPLPLRSCIEACAELDIRDFKEIIELYAVFGGYPKYYVSIEDEMLFGKGTKEILDRFFLQENAILDEEVSQILSLEFGRRSGIYYDILTAIAQGNTRIGEIASCLRKKQTDLTRQMDELVNYFEIVGVEKPVVRGRGVYYIKHPLIDFWFRFFYKNLSSYKRREPRLMNKIKSGMNSFIGKRFEVVCREFIAENHMFNFPRIGKQWGKIRGAPKGENTYELDIVALHEGRKEILFGECKWQDRLNAKSVIKGLAEKARFVDWYPENRTERFVVFAKSFRKKIDEFEGNKVYCFDLSDMEKVFSKGLQKKTVR